MNKNIFKKLCLNYNKEANKDLYELWEDNLRCYDEEEIQDAINYIIAKDKFFPTFNRVLEVVKEIVSKEKYDDSDSKIIEKMKRLNIHPDWIDKDIKNEALDKQTEEEFEDFNNFIKEFRDDD